MRQLNIISRSIILLFVLLLGIGVVYSNSTILQAAEFGSSNCPPGQTPSDQPGLECELLNPAPNQLVDIDNYQTVIIAVIRLLLGLAGAVGVIFLVIGGYQYITSRGNEEGMEKAKRTIMGAIVGIVIIVLAFAIVNIINNTLVTAF